MSVTVLGIETSCDETAIGLVTVLNDSSSLIIDEKISSQIKLHREYGGVVPELASREHMTALPILLSDLESSIGNLKNKIDAIAVTVTPGLKGCLLIGANFAKGLSTAWNKPLIAAHHIEGHLFSAFLNKKVCKYPFLSLVVSGGHTELVLVENFAEYKVIAKTIDDAAGEAFDKSAYLLGFPYPGGASLSKCAQSYTPDYYSKQTDLDFKLPKVMRDSDGFSFSGLKTAISLLIKRHANIVESDKAHLCYVIQESIVDTLVYKTQKAFTEYPNIKSFALVGGVAANEKLRGELTDLCKKNQVEFYLPQTKYCTDNASMIALVGGLSVLAKKPFQSEVTARFSLEDRI